MHMKIYFKFGSVILIKESKEAFYQLHYFVSYFKYAMDLHLWKILYL